LCQVYTRLDGPRSRQPPPSALHVVCQSVAAIEAMFGIGLFALFVFTLGNRMRRS
jgi:hypothetical protein